MVAVQNESGQRLISNALPQHCPTVEGNFWIVIAGGGGGEGRERGRGREGEGEEREEEGRGRRGEEDGRGDIGMQCMQYIVGSCDALKVQLVSSH